MVEESVAAVAVLISDGSVSLPMVLENFLTDFLLLTRKGQGVNGGAQ